MMANHARFTNPFPRTATHREVRDMDVYGCMEPSTKAGEMGLFFVALWMVACPIILVSIFALHLVVVLV